MSDTTDFVSALVSASRPPLSGAAVHLDAVRRHGEDALAAAARLQEYRDYLARVRAFRVSDAAVRPAQLDRQILAQGHAALADAEQFCRSGVPLAREQYFSGDLGAFIASAIPVMHASGPQRLVDLWAYATATSDRRALLERVGLNERMLGAFEEVLGDVDASVTASGSHLVVEGTLGGRRERREIETAPRPAHPRSIGELLAQGRFEALADALERGEPAYLGVPDAAAVSHIEDVAMFSLLSTQRELVRHVRSLEDAGLATHEGGEPGTVAIILGIAGLVLLLGSAVLSYYCEKSDVPEGAACALSVLVRFIALVLLLSALKKSTQPNVNAGSTWSERALLKSLEEKQ